MTVIQAPETVLCKYRRSLDAIQADPEFDQDDAAQVADWLAGNTPASHVARDMKRAGYRVGATTVKDHRRGECACEVAS